MVSIHRFKKIRSCMIFMGNRLGIGNKGCAEGVFYLRRERRAFDMNIYIGNLSTNTTEDTLKVLFAEFGEINGRSFISF